MSYKESILLPKTNFPMKARLPQTEPLRVEQWQQQGVYQKMLAAAASSPVAAAPPFVATRPAAPARFVMPDGPPYANGSIHIGHVLNKVLKDIILKFKNMAGQQAPFVPGWDCHGLPIELKVTKKKSRAPAKPTASTAAGSVVDGTIAAATTDSVAAKTAANDPSSLSQGLAQAAQQVRTDCRNEALKWIEKQKQQFIRLGILADWQKPYLTMQPHYEASELQVLAQLIDKGLVYQGQKPVHWCPKLQTALSASEVEHREHKSHCVFVKFYATKKINNLKTAFAVWTTTPWTLPANHAVCLNENLDYALYQVGDEAILISPRLYPQLQKHKPEWPADLKPLQVFKGHELKGTTLKHPFLEREVPVLFGPHVTDDTGTGCVHTAPGHGLDDYNVGLKNNLPIESPVDERGRYRNDGPDFLQGQNIWAAQPVIVERMKSQGTLLAEHSLKHSYPYNPRTNTPMIFRCTQQWFISLEKGLRQKALRAIENIEFVPSWGRQRMQSMLENAPDWCLSRQRLWGVPLPVFYCSSCKTALLSAKVVRCVAEAVKNSSQGIEVYHQKPANEFVRDAVCAQCKGREFTKGTDILDVWFDSGTCHTGVQGAPEGTDFPAHCYLEGSDQHRGWFFTSLLSSLGAYDTAPYKALITHGFVNDAKGHKMSKSAGNVVEPEKIINQYGAEILRLQVACEDYGQDINLSKQTFDRVSETYRRLRNVFRFLLGNLHDFNFQRDQVEFKDLLVLDKWVLLQLDELVVQVRQAYDEYAFHKVYHLLNGFFTSKLSALYLDVLKDRLYTAKATGQARRGAQTVFYYLLQSLTPMMAPILSFLAEEVFEHLQQLPGQGGNTRPTDTTTTTAEAIATQSSTTSIRAEGGDEGGCAAGGTSSIFEQSFPQPYGWGQRATDEEQKFFGYDKERGRLLPGRDEGWAELRAARESVLPVIEQQRTQKTIGSSLEARVVLKADSHQYAVCKKFEADLKELLIVSQLELCEVAQSVDSPVAQPVVQPVDQSGGGALDSDKPAAQTGRAFEVQVFKAEGDKCVRCWHYSTQIKNEICPKCVEALGAGASCVF